MPSSWSPTASSPRPRRALHNPARDPALLHGTGLNDAVREHALAAPRALDLINRSAAQVLALAERTPPGRLVRLTVACQGGRHRSVAVAEEVARRIWEAWGGAYAVEAEHHHVDHPLLTASA
ncbi:RapZ C-terminal domain-containing protein [Streptomyces sp. DT197]|uniref:RapZ C-terminal domain-containing protein n=1 Tax=Streptomyces sp. DT197 TaxID=3393417 RepID=UPI003676D43F